MCADPGGGSLASSRAGVRALGPHRMAAVRVRAEMSECPSGQQEQRSAASRDAAAARDELIAVSWPGFPSSPGLRYFFFMLNGSVNARKWFQQANPSVKCVLLRTVKCCVKACCAP